MTLLININDFQITNEQKLVKNGHKTKKIEARERIMEQSRVEERQVATQERQKAPKQRLTTIEGTICKSTLPPEAPRGAFARAGYT